MASSTDSFISIVGSYKVHPQDAAAFAKIAAESVGKTVHKPGCLYYIASQDLIEPGLFHLSEGWADKAALDAHGASPDLKETFDQATKLRILNRTMLLSDSKGRIPDGLNLAAQPQ